MNETHKIHYVSQREQQDSKQQQEHSIPTSKYKKTSIPTLDNKQDVTDQAGLPLLFLENFYIESCDMSDDHHSHPPD
jgi:dipeptidase